MNLELYPALSESLLKKYNFLELYPPDGGGNFIMRELFGTIDDREITGMILDSDVMAEFGGIGNIDFKRFERWRTIEKSCWINRCYFIVMMARTAWLDKDRSLAEKVLQVMLHFKRSCPPPDDLQAHWQRVNKRMVEDYNSKSPAEIAADETDVEYVWYDMQVAQRLISFLYASYFISGLLPDAAEELAEVEELLKTHVRVIADPEAFQQPYCDNHQSLRAIACYWGLPLLKNDTDHEAVNRRIFDLCCWHIANEFLPGSGALFENSPSYHAFVLWHARDFSLLAERRGEKLPEEVAKRLDTAKKALSAYRRPDGLSLTVNDSYQYSLTGFAEVLGTDVGGDGFTVLKPGGIVAGQAGECYAAMDVSGFIGEFSHYHGGKNSPVVLWQREAFLEDPGCPSYDAPEFALCRRSDHHSTMLVDGSGDTHAYSMYGFDRWAELEYDDFWKDNGDGTKSFKSILTSNVEAWRGIRWERCLTIGERMVKLSDRAGGDGKTHTYTLLFTLAPQVEISDLSERKWLLNKGGLRGVLRLDFDGEIEVRKRTISNCQKRAVCEVWQLQIDLKNCSDMSSETVLQFL